MEQSIKELQDKSLQLLFGFILEAQIGEKFIIADDSLTTINKNGVEKVIPIEYIDKPSGDFFLFTQGTFKCESDVKIVRTRDSVFVFGVKSLQESIRANKDKVKSKGGIWFIKQAEIGRAAFHAINRTNDKKQS